MRGYASTANGSREKLTLANGIPVTIALEYPSGKRVQSRIPGAPDQVYYTLTDGRGFYADLQCAELIEQLGLVTREPFTVCKYGRDWEVARAGHYPTPAISTQQQNGPAPRRAAPAQVNEDTTPHATPSESATKLEYALKTAVLAASNAEKYGGEIGYTVRFDAEQIKCMAITVLINMEGGRK